MLMESIMFFNVLATGSDGAFTGLRMVTISFVVLMENMKRTETAVILFQ